MGKSKPLKGKESPDLLRKAISTLGFVLFLNLFFFHQFGNISFSLIFLGFFFFLSGVFLSFVKKEIPWKLFGGVFLTLVLFSILLGTRANGFVTFLVGVGMVGISGMYLYAVSRNIPFFRNLSEALSSPLILAKDYILGAVRLAIEVLTPTSTLWSFFALGRKKNFTHLIPWTVGLIIALPIFFILISMLSGADPIFSSYVVNIEKFLGRFFQGAFWQRLFAHFVISGIFAIFLSPFLYLSGRKTFSSPVAFLHRFSLVPQATVVMAFVAVALGTFLLVQWPYVFASVPYETSLSQFGIATYSEYVKKGFGEFLTVSLFVYILIWIGLLISRNKNSGRSFLMYLQLFVLAEYGVFLFSIARRIYLYQQYHGWSLGRLYGGFLLVWIASMAFTLFLRYIWQRTWIVVEIVATLVLIIGMGLFNAEHFLATVHPPTVNKRVDYVYLSRLSADGVEGWKKAYEYSKKILENPLNEKEERIDKEQRREIAYSGFILHALTRNFATLLNTYGTVDDKRTYYKALLGYLTDVNNEALLRFQPQIAKVEKMEAGRDEVTIFPTSTPVSIYLDNTPMKELLKAQQFIEREKVRVGKGDFSGDFLLSMYLPAWSPYLSYDYSSETVDFYTYALPDQSFRRDMKSQERLLDKIYTWNYSEIHAFNQLNTLFRSEELITLQKRFLALYRRISFQGKENREYDSDISFDTPFLEPL